MSNYFSNFPLTQHDVENNGTKVYLTNILRRFKIRSKVKDNLEVYYDYNIQEGDRADIIAEKYYGNANFAWIILHFNDITDPIFGWPLFGNDFDDYVKGKYGSVEEAKSTVKEYRKILQQQETKYDGTIIYKKTVVVDLDTYTATPIASRESISQYDYEEEFNEAKRKIKILDKRYLNQLKDEVKDILKNGV